MDFPELSFPVSSVDEVDGIFKRMLDNLFDAVYFTDRERRIIYWNQAAEALTGYSANDVIGKCCADNILVHVNESGHPLCTRACPLSQSMTDGRSRRAEVYLHHKRGHRVPVEVRVCPVRGSDGEIVGAVEIFNDNSRQKAIRERARDLAKLAFLDPATEVANRRYMDQQLSQQVDQHSKHGTPLGIILADVDEFKTVNDTYGHVAGDAALVTVVKTLSLSLRASDMLGRWGGDEFLVILPGITKEILVETCERCRALVAQSTVPVESSQIQVTISVGATMAVPGDSAESLLKRADQRLYGSKQSGRNRVSL